jgi:hypothetical protein
MRLLVSGATATLRRYPNSTRLGSLLVPGAGNSVHSALAAGLSWAADNAAFTGFDPGAFCGMLGRIAGHPGCLFVACPDVVGDAVATLARFVVWEPIIREVGLPIALVGQDGAETLELPWGRFDALFLGGSTDWKLGAGAAALAREAKARGMWLHLGRCNSHKRFRYAFALGCDSVDGSGFSRWPDQRVPLALRWLADLHGDRIGPEEAAAIGFFRDGEALGFGVLDGPGWSIDHVTLTEEGVYQVAAQHRVEPAACPHCFRCPPGGTRLYRHGSVESLLRDAPRHGHAVVIRVRRTRFRCAACGRTFAPLPGGTSHGRSVTDDLRRYAVHAACDLPLRAVARTAGIDEKTVRLIRDGDRGVVGHQARVASEVDCQARSERVDKPAEQV